MQHGRTYQAARMLEKLLRKQPIFEFYKPHSLLSLEHPCKLVLGLAGRDDQHTRPFWTLQSLFYVFRFLDEGIKTKRDGIYVLNLGEHYKRVSYIEARPNPKIFAPLRRPAVSTIKLKHCA